jgi:3-deoxy-manno-octulosonate cytidylyltransferase (CMP-KDO synthetase)
MASTRLPEKVLVDIGGRPLLWHVTHRVLKMKHRCPVVVLTESERVEEVVRSWGVDVLLTDPNCRSGTERIASVVHRLGGDWIFNVQGDEPFIDPGLLDEMVERVEEEKADILTPVFKIQEEADLPRPSVVKVVLGQENRILYFSRSPIPFVRDVPPGKWLQKIPFWGHVGVYGYRRSVLEAFHTWPETSLERAESLEQLRWLAAGQMVRAHVTTYRGMAVDTPEDLEKVRRRWEKER